MKKAFRMRLTSAEHDDAYSGIMVLRCPRKTPIATKLSREGTIAKLRTWMYCVAYMATSGSGGAKSAKQHAAQASQSRTRQQTNLKGHFKLQTRPKTS
eukprot:189838-Chlamydomonas_euryale.AAC.5